MDTRTIGRTGLELTALSFGAATLGNLYQPTTDDEAQRTLDAAWDAGIRYFDTAPHYGLGLSEQRLGTGLAGRPRAAYTLSTKVGRRLVPNTRDPDRLDPHFVVPSTHDRVWDFSRDGILRTLESSLQRLDTDHVDIVFLHDPDDHWEQAAGEGFSALAELRSAGVVRAIGAGMNQSEMLARFVRETDTDVVMVAGRYTLLEQGAQDDLLPAAQERGTAVVAVGVFNSGLLSLPRPGPDAKYDYVAAPPALIQRTHTIADVCERHGVTLPAAALHFPLMHPAVVSVAIGMGSAAQVERNAGLYGQRIPDELWSELRQAGLLRPDAVIAG